MKDRVIAMLGGFASAIVMYLVIVAVIIIFGG